MPEPGNPQGLNRFGHVLNNPLLYTAPSGHYIVEDYEDDPYWSYSSPGNLLLGPTPVPPPTPLEDENGSGEVEGIRITGLRKGPIDPLSTAEKVTMIVTGGIVVSHSAAVWSSWDCVRYPDCGSNGTAPDRRGDWYTPIYP